MNKTRCESTAFFLFVSFLLAGGGVSAACGGGAKLLGIGPNQIVPSVNADNLNGIHLWMLLKTLQRVNQDRLVIHIDKLNILFMQIHNIQPALYNLILKTK